MTLHQTPQHFVAVQSTWCPWESCCWPAMVNMAPDSHCDPKCLSCLASRAQTDRRIICCRPWTACSIMSGMLGKKKKNPSISMVLISILTHQMTQTGSSTCQHFVIRSHNANAHLPFDEEPH